MRMIGQRPPGNESHHHKTQDCEPRGRAVLLGSLTYCSPPGCPSPIKSLALSAHVSPRPIHFRVLDVSPVQGPGRGPPSCNKTTAVRSPCTAIRENLFSAMKTHHLGSPDEASAQPKIIFKNMAQAEMASLMSRKPFLCPLHVCAFQQHLQSASAETQP